MFKNPPVITAVVPIDSSTFKPLSTGKIVANGMVELRGSNLVPTGTLGDDPGEWIVHFAHDETELELPAVGVDNVKGTIRATAPDSGHYDVSVITPTQPAIESATVGVKVS